MLRIVRFDIYTVRLPFRFAFKHSLASRRYSENVIVRVECESATGAIYIGYGECIPRDYVTGETVESAVNVIKSLFAPALIGREFVDLTALTAALQECYQLGHDHSFSAAGAPGTRTESSTRQGAAFCAIESALLDVWGRFCGQSLAQMFGGNPVANRTGIQYGAVVPFGGKKALLAMLWFYKIYGFKTVKLKVGVDQQTDLAKVRLARRIMGDTAIIRCDANCAWSVEETVRFAQAAHAYNLASIEQPIPPGDLDGLRRISESIAVPVVADESLCTIGDARALAAGGAVKAFNIRLSKVGGF
ncbi:MAG TPA: enolase C-terminal domain-like protein, partial [Chroococcales cyanobacterium]